MSEMHRMTLEFSKLDKEKLDSLIEASGAASKTEAIRRAIRLHLTLLELLREDPGARIELASSDGRPTKILVLT